MQINKPKPKSIDKLNYLADNYDYSKIALCILQFPNEYKNIEDLKVLKKKMAPCKKSSAIIEQHIFSLSHPSSEQKKKKSNPEKPKHFSSEALPMSQNLQPNSYFHDLRVNKTIYVDQPEDIGVNESTPPSTRSLDDISETIGCYANNDKWEKVLEILLEGSQIGKAMVVAIFIRAWQQKHKPICETVCDVIKELYDDEPLTP